MGDAELIYKIALTKIPLVGAITAKNLIGYCGGVQEVFRAKKRDLIRIPGIGEQIANNIVRQNVLEEAEKEMLFVEREGIEALFYLDARYPQRLRHLPDAPVLLYYRGTTPLNTPRTLGIVGTRQPTHRGIAICEGIISDLAGCGVVIISGLAYGIDVAAHRHALRMNLPTIGVLGHGLDQIYPPAHRKVAEEMAAHGGLLTEFSSASRPDRENFPMRNRIVAGLCDALLVIETNIRGGSMITAQLANDYHKEVFAVPGRVGDTLSAGCHLLIKSHRATLVESAADLQYHLGWEDQPDGTTTGQGVQVSMFPELSDDERKIVELLRTKDTMEVDLLAHETDLEPSTLAALLLQLEFKGLIRTLPGKRYLLG